MPLSRVWSRSKIIAEDLTGEDLSDVLELHSDASAWWVLPRNDPYAERELRGVASALDLDELAIHDLLADDRRVKYEQVGQARIVITGAVSVDDARQEILVHPLSIIATDRALICLAGDTEALRPAQILTGQTDKLATLGIEAALPLVLNAVVASYEDAVDWIETAQRPARRPAVRGPALGQARAAEGVPAEAGTLRAPPADRADAFGARRARR